VYAEEISTKVPFGKFAKAPNIHLRHEETAEDDLVEARVGAASKEAVKLDKKEEVGVLRLGGLASALLNVVAADVDTHLAC